LIRRRLPLWALLAPVGAALWVLSLLWATVLRPLLVL
jgi:hypothetical protein